MKQTIKFLSAKSWVDNEAKSTPAPASKNLPDWYKKASRYELDSDGNPIIGPDSGKFLTWKSCPAIYDIMITGYVFKTPCDIEFSIGDNGPIAKVLDTKYEEFIQIRPPMQAFEVPRGYEASHFAWWMDWGIKLPKGYSALYSQPYNRFDLPFITTSGIIDNDKVNLPGTMPFFIATGWTGILPAGTPYSQILPFKRENWNSEIEIQEPRDVYKKTMENIAKYRKPNGGIYQKNVWERRYYE